MNALENAKKNGLSPELRDELLMSMSEKDRVAFLSSDTDGMRDALFHAKRTLDALEERYKKLILLARDCDFPVDEVIPLPSGGGLRLEVEANALDKENVTGFRTGARPEDEDEASFYDACQSKYSEKVAKVEVSFSDFTPSQQETAKRLGFVVRKPFLRLTVVGRKH